MHRLTINEIRTLRASGRLSEQYTNYKRRSRSNTNALYLVVALLLVNSYWRFTGCASTFLANNEVVLHQSPTDNIIISHAIDGGSTDSRIRVIALCTCLEDNEGMDINTSIRYQPWDVAFRKIAELMPQLWYAGRFEVNADIGEHCEDILEQWMAAQLQQAQLAPNATTTVIEVIYNPQCNNTRPLNEALVGQSTEAEPPNWIGGGMHPPQLTHYQRFFFDWGEVARSKQHKCDPNDVNKIHIHKSRVLWTKDQNRNCAVVHRPTILIWAEAIRRKRISDGVSPQNETVLSMLSRPRTLREAQGIMHSKSKFCVLVTMTTFQPKYAVDALVRHALCRLLTKQYKPCLALRAWKGDMKKHNITIATTPSDTYKIQGDFKFVISMPNHFQEGYLVEKTVHPYLAASFPITASPNIGQYVNANSMVTCNVPPEELDRVQRYYKGKFNWMPFDTTPDMWDSNSNGRTIQPIHYDPYADNGMGDEPVLEFVASQWEKALQPCIDEIIRLDSNDDAYIEKLLQPYLLNGGQHSLFDGKYLAVSMLHWFIWAKSPLVRGLEGQIENLEGIWEQTLKRV